MIDRACEDRLYRTPKFAGVIRYNVLKSCATRVCCACLDEIACVAVMYLTLRTVCERHGRKNPLPFPFSKRSHVGNLRQTIQGKGRSSKRKENRRLSFLFAPAAGAATLPPSADGESPAEVQQKTLCPGRANPPAAVRVPQSSGAGKRSRPDGSHLPGQAVKFPLDIPQSPTTILLRKRSN